VLHQDLNPLTLTDTLTVRTGLLRLDLAGHGLTACLIDCGQDLGLDTPFDPAWFDRLGIDRPPAVARSVPKRQAEFLFGRLAAAQALAHQGSAERTVGVGPGREPLWPAGWCGSLSHTRRYAMAVVARDNAWGGLGVDIEQVVDAAQSEAIEHGVLNPGERERLRLTGGALPEAQVQTLVFSAKECFYKAAYARVGQFFGFDAADVAWIDRARQRLGLRVNLPLGGAFAPGDTFEIGFGAVDATTLFTGLALR
jgi:enterobactin synthetase component D